MGVRGSPWSVALGVIVTPRKRRTSFVAIGEALREVFVNHVDLATFADAAGVWALPSVSPATADHDRWLFTSWLVSPAVASDRAAGRHGRQSRADILVAALLRSQIGYVA